MKQSQTTEFPSPFTQEHFAEIGMAAVLHNYQQAIDVLTMQMRMIRQHQVDRQVSRAQAEQAEPAAALAALNIVNQTLALPEAGRKKPGRRRGTKNGAGSYWQQLTPAERSAEMQRRMQVRRGERAPDNKKTRAAEAKDLPVVALASKALHPRDASHPDHAAWVRKVGRASRARWKNFTPEERAAAAKRMGEISRAQHVKK